MEARMSQSGDTWTDLPVFGEQIAGYDYQLRPGAYAVLFDAQQRLAVLRTPLGYFLPGGGTAPGETPEETLQREVGEECGYAITGMRKLGEAIECVFAAAEQRYFRKHGVFFVATLARRLPQEPESNHTLLWLTPEEAVTRLSHQSQAWAVQQVVRAGTYAS
jgi:8-oxo-dGTP diphosphatase